MPTDIGKCLQISEETGRYRKIPEDISRYWKIADAIGYLLFPLLLDS